MKFKTRLVFVRKLNNVRLSGRVANINDKIENMKNIYFDERKAGLYQVTLIALVFN